jgi:hypothetical protein
VHKTMGLGRVAFYEEGMFFRIHESCREPTKSPLDTREA